MSDDEAFLSTVHAVKWTTGGREESDMSIELTREQSEALAADLETLQYDTSPWTSAEMAALAVAAFARLDDTDYCSVTS